MPIWEWSYETILTNQMIERVRNCIERKWWPKRIMHNTRACYARSCSMPSLEHDVPSNRKFTVRRLERTLRPQCKWSNSCLTIAGMHCKWICITTTMSIWETASQGAVTFTWIQIYFPTCIVPFMMPLRGERLLMLLLSHSVAAFPFPFSNTLECHA